MAGCFAVASSMSPKLPSAWPWMISLSQSTTSTLTGPLSTETEKWLRKKSLETSRRWLLPYTARRKIQDIISIIGILECR